MTPQTITDKQADMLTLLLKTPMTLRETIRAMHFSLNSVNGHSMRYINQCLIAAGMIERGGRGGHVHYVTTYGKDCLLAHHDGGSKPPVIQVRSGTTNGSYKPPQAYYRNNGNVHIPSFGVRC